MKQYHELLETILEKGAIKQPAREGMPTTKSVFGYQFRHNLADGFPLLTTKKLSFKNIVIELLWFLKGDTNIKYLVDNGCNIWNEDAFNYYVKLCKQHKTPPICDPEGFVNILKSDAEFNDPDLSRVCDYKWGDCGKQYGWLWRNWEGSSYIQRGGNHISTPRIDQLKDLITGLKNKPDSRRHIITAWNPTTLDEMALNACHAFVQFNCRPLTGKQKLDWARKEKKITPIAYLHNEAYLHSFLDAHTNVPKYYLDCQMYQRSADSFLGVPYNIASYALLTHILAKVCNMIPGEFIHTFGDVHIYDNHMEQVKEQLSREPRGLPKLLFKDEFHYLCDNVNKEDITTEESVQWLLDSINQWEPDLFELENYNPHPPIKGKLSTGLK